MCRNIHTLFNYEPPATEDEVRDAALQYVRKISGFTKPSQANTAAFERAVDEVTAAGWASVSIAGSTGTSSRASPRTPGPRWRRRSSWQRRGPGPLTTAS